MSQLKQAASHLLTETHKTSQSAFFFFFLKRENLPQNLPEGSVVHGPEVSSSQSENPSGFLCLLLKNEETKNIKANGD